MKIFTFLDSHYDVVEIVKAADHKSSLKKTKSKSVNKHTLYYSEDVTKNQYYTFN